MIASHYAEPLARKILKPVPLYAVASDGAEPVCKLEAGEPFDLLDNSVGWAWGYAGKGRRVGYVKSEAIGA